MALPVFDTYNGRERQFQAASNFFIGTYIENTMEIRTPVFRISIVFSCFYLLDNAFLWDGISDFIGLKCRKMRNPKIKNRKVMNPNIRSPQTWLHFPLLRKANSCSF